MRLFIILVMINKFHICFPKSPKLCWVIKFIYLKIMGFLAIAKISFTRLQVMLKKTGTSELHLEKRWLGLWESLWCNFSKAFCFCLLLKYHCWNSHFWIRKSNPIFHLYFLSFSYLSACDGSKYTMSFSTMKTTLNLRHLYCFQCLLILIEA